jgi:hypothetical protein
MDAKRMTALLDIGRRRRRARSVEGHACIPLLLEKWN